MDLEKVAELKYVSGLNLTDHIFETSLRALLPDLVRFAYIPRDQLQINADGTPGTFSKERREKSPDFSAFSFSDSTSGFSSATQHEDEHVLVLHFAEAKGTGKKSGEQMYVIFRF